jgi:lipopolysaccharide transport system permease protein
MIYSIRQLVHARDLLRAWTDRIVRSRYQQTILGGLWILVQPLATVAMFSIIFTFFVPVDTGDIPYPVFSYVAMVPWLLLSNSLNDMTVSLVTNMSLVTKIYFPREILPISSMLARLIDFFVAESLVIVLMLFFRLPILTMNWLFLPVILIIQLALITGLGLLLSSANVFYRDIKSLLTLGIQLWFYASPIIYPVSMVPERLRLVYSLNPMSGILESYRAVLINNTTPPPSLYISALMSIVVLVFGVWLFKRVEFQIADIV